MSRYQTCIHCGHEVFFLVYDNITVSYNAKLVINGLTGTREIRQHPSDETMYYTDPACMTIRCGKCGTKAKVKVKTEKEFYHWYRNP